MLNASEALSEMDAGESKLVLEGQRAPKSVRIEPDRRVRNARTAGDAPDHGFGIGPAGHMFQAHEGRGLDVAEAALRQRVDERDLVPGRDRALLDLKALARALLADNHLLRQVHAPSSFAAVSLSRRDPSGKYNMKNLSF